MRILYVAPYPPLKSGVVDYDFYFKRRVIKQNLNVREESYDEDRD